MPGAGERRDIGLVTDAGAEFMLRGNAGPVIAWGHGAGSWPLHFRDEQTGKPVDLLKYPQANCYLGNQGAPWLAMYPLNPKASEPGESPYDVPAGMRTQQAHFPEMSYVAHIATLDAGFLANLQYQANFMRLCDAAKSTPAKSIVSGEMRGVAWCWRHMFMAHIATKDFEAKCIADGVPFPDFLMPSSYFKTLIDNDFGFYSKFITDPSNQVFRLPTGPGTFAPWQVDYVLLALAFGVLTGHSEWAPMFLWALKNAVDRAIGTRGYPMGLGQGPYIKGGMPSWGAGTKDIFDRAQLVGGPDYDARFTQAIYDSLMGPGGDPFYGFKTHFILEYHLNTRAVLVMAQYLHKIGVLDVKTTYPELDQCVTNMDRYIRTNNSMVPRAAVVLDAAGVPDTLPPPPVTTDPGPIGNSPSTPPPPPAPAPVSGVPADALPPELDPASFQFEAKSLYDAVTAKAKVHIDLTGKVPAGGDHRLLCNVKGNGATIVYVTLPGMNPEYFARYPDTAGGALSWKDTHGGGDEIRIYNCGGLVINGGKVWQAAQQDPAPNSPPVQDPSQGNSPPPAQDPGTGNSPPVTDPPSPAPKPLARVAVSKITAAHVDRASKGEFIIVTDDKKDKAALAPLSVLPK